jgi:class 3 adenylate cyclase
MCFLFSYRKRVFALLESIYCAFDKSAYRHGVFKIETVGDCYVAVAGLPEPATDHATRVARFARACLHLMGDLTRKLEVSLGPDTTDLELRIGLHSGQVTGTYRATNNPCEGGITIKFASLFNRV